jgi:hypothetical protein
MAMDSDTAVALETAYTRIERVGFAMSVSDRALADLRLAYENLYAHVARTDLYLSGNLVPVVPFVCVPMTEQVQAIQPSIEAPHEFLQRQFVDAERPTKPYLIQWGRGSFDLTLGSNARWAEFMFDNHGESGCTLAEVLALCFHLKIHETRITRRIEFHGAMCEAGENVLQMSIEKYIMLCVLGSSFNYSGIDTVPWISIESDFTQMSVQPPMTMHGFSAAFPSCRVLDFPRA